MATGIAVAVLLGLVMLAVLYGALAMRLVRRREETTPQGNVEVRRPRGIRQVGVRSLGDRVRAEEYRFALARLPIRRASRRDRGHAG